VSTSVMGRGAVTPVRNLIRAAFIVNLLLGVYIWTGRADALIPIHEIVGIVLVLGLAVQVVFGIRARLAPGLIIAAIAVGLVAPILGDNQAAILSGDLHWIVQLIHLLLAFLFIAIAESLARRLLAQPNPTRKAE